MRTPSRPLSRVAIGVVTAGIVGVTLVVSGVFDSSHAAPSGGGTGVSSTMLARQQTLDAAADAITPVLKADPNYTGVFVDANAGRLIAYGTARFDSTVWTRALGAVPDGTTLEYGKALLNDRQVADLTAYVTTRSGQGLQFRSAGLQRLDGPFQVTTPPGHPLPAADIAYLSKYGAGTFVTSVENGGAD